MPEPVALTGEDPVGAFWSAHREGRRILVQTSGTSQTPRTVVRTTGSWVDSFPHVSRLTGLTRGSRVWVPGPLTATMNLFAHVHAQWAEATASADRGGATHAVLTPIALARALRDELLPDGATAIVSGDSLPRSTLLTARDHGVAVHQYYGASELSFVAWAADGSTLRAFPGVEIKVEQGLIWARSAYLSEGYADGDADGGPWRIDPDGFASVGDHGELSGGALVVRGRGAEGITTAGVTVVVADVERTLLPVANGSVLVIGVPDPRLGAVVSAILTDARDFERLRDVAAAELAPAQRPRQWYVVPDLPTTPAGKPDRAELARMLAEGRATRVGR